MSGAIGRRGVLTGAGALAGAALLAGCDAGGSPPGPGGPTSGSPGPTTTPGGSGPTTTPTPVYTGDARHVAVCAALANLAADLYGDLLSRADLGGYGTVPAAVIAFLGGAVGQHTTAAAAWNLVLTDAGRPAVTGIPPAVEVARPSAADDARTPTDLLVLAVDMEATVTATVVDRIAVLGSPTALVAAATIAPPAAARGATAAFLLDRVPGAPAGSGGTPLGREVEVG